MLYVLSLSVKLLLKIHGPTSKNLFYTAVWTVIYSFSNIKLINWFNYVRGFSFVMLRCQYS